MADIWAHVDAFPRAGKTRSYIVPCKRKPDGLCWGAINCADYDPIDTGEPAPGGQLEPEEPADA